jgi:hypothetical protein|tara:strand:- start:149 stop:592 length:444 start_codon:yes stop_codon:yes gene_type:complete
MAVLEGKAYWASVLSPNTKFEPVFSVNLVVDQEVAEEYKRKGFAKQVKEMEDVGTALVIKRKVNWTDRKSGQVHTRPAPKLFDKSKQPLDCQVGNGSRVKVQFREWESGEWSGLDFQAMQVLDLVEYNAPAGAEFDVEESLSEEDEL